MTRHYFLIFSYCVGESVSCSCALIWVLHSGSVFLVLDQSLWFSEESLTVLISVLGSKGGMNSGIVCVVKMGS